MHGEFIIIGKLRQTEIIARGTKVRVRRELNREYGHGDWRKMKAIATVEYVASGRRFISEVHYYEAHGVGRRAFKVKTDIKELL